MATRRRDVDLVIRARNEASAAIDSISEAFRAFSGDIERAERSAAEGDSAFSRLGQSLRRLQTSFSGTSVAGRLGQELQRVEGVLGRVEVEARGARQEVDRYGREAAQAATQTAQFRARVDEQAVVVRRIKDELTAARGAVRAFTADQRRIPEIRRIYERQAAAVVRLRGEYAQARTRLNEYQQGLSAVAGAENRIVQAGRFAVATLARKNQELGRATEAFREYAAGASRARTELTRIGQQTRGSLLQSLGEQRTRLQQAQQSFNDYSAAAQRFSRQIRETVNPSRELTAAFNANRAAAAQSRQVIREQQVAYAQLRAILRETGGDVDAFAARQARAAEILRRTATLARENQEVGRATEAFREYAASASRARTELIRIGQQTRGSLLRSLGEQRTRLQQTQQSFNDYSAAAQRFSRQIRATVNPSRELTAAFNANRAAAAQSRQVIREQQVAYAQLRAILRETGGDVDAFAARQARAAEILRRAAMRQMDLGRSGQAAAQANERLQASQQRVEQSTNRLTSATRRLSAAQRMSARQGRGVAGAFRQVYGEARQALSFTQRLRSEVLALVAAYAGLFAVIRGAQNILGAAQTLQGVRNRLTVVFGGDTAAVAQELDFIRRNAERLGIAFSTLAGEYSKFAIATQNTNLQGQATRDIFISVAEAARVQNLSLDQIEGTFLALTQIVSKGVVSMEELRRQLGDRLPGAIQIMATALDLSVAELIKLVETGSLSSDVLVEFADELNRRFSGQLPTALEQVAAAFGRLQNQIFRAFVAIGEGGAIEGFTNTFQRLATLLSEGQVQSVLARIGVAAGALAMALAFTAENFQALTIAIAFFVGRRFSPIIIALVAAFLRFPAVLRLARRRLNAFRGSLVATQGTMVAATTTTRGLTAAIRGLLGATGIGSLVGLIGAGIAYWVTQTDEATEAQVRHLAVVDRVRNAYDQARGSLREFRGLTGEVATTELRQALATTRGELAEIGDELRSITGLNFIEGIFGNRMRLQGFRTALEVLTTSLVAGRIGLQDYRSGIDRLVESYREIAPETIDLGVSALEAGERFDSLRQKATDLGNAILAISAPTEIAAKAFEELGTEIDATTSDADRRALALLRFQEGLRALSAGLPGEEDRRGRLEEDRVLAEQAEGLRDLAIQAGVTTDVVDQLFAQLIQFRRADDVFEGATTGATAIGRLLQEITLLADTDVAQIAARLETQISDALGEGLVSALTSRQQAVLGVIVQTFGELPVPLAQAIEQGLAQGSTAGAAALIRTLEDLSEADLLANIFSGDEFNVDALVAFQQRLAQVQAQAAERTRQRQEQEAERERQRIEAAREGTRQTLSDLDFQLQQQSLIEAGYEREAVIQERIREARQQDANITQDQIESLRDRVGLLFDIENQGARQEAQQQRIAEAEQRVNDLLDLRSQLEQELAAVREQGLDPQRAIQLQMAVEALGPEIRDAAEAAVVLVEALGDGSAASDALLSRLRLLTLEAKELGQGVRITLMELAMLGQGAGTSALQMFARAISEGENAIDALKAAFRSFLSDFLLGIARMIAMQIFFNALQSAFGGGGILGFLGLPAGHDGGIVGRSGVLMPAGGAGLRSDEVPYILQTGEEVLSRDNPRNAANGGGGSAGSVEVINAIDGPSFLDEALQSQRGKTRVLNFISANRRAVRNAIGV